MHKKGQAAMEFLMTYGWAILVVLIAIGALMYFIKPTEMLPEKCTIPTGSGLFCDKWSASVGSVSLKVKNALDEQLTIQSGATTYVSDGTNSCQLAANVVIAASGTGTVTLDANGPVGTCAGLAASGSKIQGDLSITYQDTDLFTKTTGGQLIVQVP